MLEGTGGAIRGKHPHKRGEDGQRAPSQDHSSETPPQAWGRPCLREPGEQSGGNTPTSVGKTSALGARNRNSWKHPHKRGEDSSFPPLSCILAETPPQAWGRRPVRKSLIDNGGNTPTSVGKTPGRSFRPRFFEKHPHKRGEDPNIMMIAHQDNTTYCADYFRILMQ